MIIIIIIMQQIHQIKQEKVWKDLTQENFPKKIVTFKIGLIMCQTLFYILYIYYIQSSQWFYEVDVIIYISQVKKRRYKEIKQLEEVLQLIILSQAELHLKSNMMGARKIEYKTHNAKT